MEKLQEIAEEIFERSLSPVSRKAVLEKLIRVEKDFQKSFDQKFAKNTEQEAKEKFISNTTRSLTSLSKRCVEWYSPGQIQMSTSISIAPTTAELVLELVRTINNCLDHVSYNFPKAIEPGIELPKPYHNSKTVYYGQIKKKWENKFSDINPELLEILCRPIQKFTGAKKPKFNQLTYLRKLVTEIEKISSHSKDPECKIKGALLHINYNSFNFHRYLTNEIYEAVEKQDNRSEAINTLIMFRKKLNQTIPFPKIAYREDRQSQLKMTLEYVKEEIAYYNQTQTFGSSQVQNTNSSKLKSGISVAQLALFIRLCRETGIIVNENKTEVLRKSTETLKTKHSTHISVNSLQSKYHNVETGTVKNLKPKIIEMLNKLNSM
jgi:hypothetical protein